MGFTVKHKILRTGDIRQNPHFTDGSHAVLETQGVCLKKLRT